MRIAVVHSFYTSTRPSGENTVVTDQVEELKCAGHEVLLVGRRTDDEAQRTIYPVRAALTVVTGRGPSPGDDLMRFDPDVVHLHNTFPNWGTTWLSEWGSRTVVTLHNFRPLCSNGLLFRDGHPCTDCLRIPVLPAVRHRCYRRSAVASIPTALGSAPIGALRGVPRRAAKVLCLNEDAAETYRRYLGVDVAVVPNFVPPAARVQRPERRWIFVGRLSDEKGIDRLLENWPRNERLDVAGEGPLRALVERVSAQRPEIRLLGLVDRPVVLEMLGSYAGLILPSMCAESLATVVLEALAAGVPAILSSRVQASESLVDRGAAETFDPTWSTEQLARVTASVWQRRESMSAAAAAVYQDEYSPAAWLSRIQPIYEQVARVARDGT